MVENNLDQIASDLERILDKEVLLYSGPVNIILTIDTSGSMNPSISLMKTCATALLQRIRLSDTDPRVMMALLQFANSAKVEQIFTHSAFEMSSSIHKMTRAVGDGTKTNIALETCNTLFKASGRNNAHNVVILFTDGTSDDSSATIQKAIELKEKHKCTIIVIGVGSVNQEECRSVAQQIGYNFTIKSFEELSKLFTLMTTREEAPVIQYDSKMSDRVIFIAKSNEKNLKEVQVEMKGERDWIRVCNSPWSLVEIKNLKPSTDYTFRVCTISKNSQLASHWSAEITIRTLNEIHGQKAFEDTENLEQTVKALRNKCLTRKLPFGLQSYNLGLNGSVGVGKSSLANSILRAFDKLPTFTTGSKSGTHVTTAIDKYTIEILDFVLTIVDTWGWNDNLTNWFENTFKSYTRGKFMDRRKMDVGHGVDLDTDIYINKETFLSDYIHTILFVVTPAVLSNNTELVNLTKIYNEAIEEKLSCLFIITKFDDPQLVENTILCQPGRLREMYGYEKVHNIIDMFVMKTGIPSTCIFPICSYQDGELQSNEKDFLILYMLDKALDFAETNVEKLRKTVPVKESFPQKTKVVLPIHPTDAKIELQDKYGNEIGCIIEFDVNQTFSKLRKVVNDEHAFGKIGTMFVFVGVTNEETDIIHSIAKVQGESTYIVIIEKESGTLQNTNVMLSVRNTQGGEHGCIMMPALETSLPEMRQIILDECGVLVDVFKFAGTNSNVSTYQEKLPKYTLKHCINPTSFIVIEIVQEKKESFSEDLLCGICIDRPKNYAIEPCGHMYCSKCIDECRIDALNKSKPFKCPGPGCGVDVTSSKRIFL